MKQMVLGAAMALFLQTGTAFAGDSHANYYYPEPTTRETYTSKLGTGPSATRTSRIGFTVGINEAQQKRGYAPRYHLFAKGAHSQKLILVATSDNHYNTLFRLRALMASLSADARATALFSGLPNPEALNFLDLCKMVGFEQVTLSDGFTIAHRIDIK